MNTLDRVNDNLHQLLEELMDEENTPDQMDELIKKSKAVCEVASKITDTAKLQLDASALMLKYGSAEVPIPEQFRIANSPQKISSRDFTND